MNESSAELPKEILDPKVDQLIESFSSYLSQSTEVKVEETQQDTLRLLEFNKDNIEYRLRDERHSAQSPSYKTVELRIGKKDEQGMPVYEVIRLARDHDETYSYYRKFKLGNYSILDENIEPIMIETSQDQAITLAKAGEIYAQLPKQN